MEAEAQLLRPLEARLRARDSHALRIGLVVPQSGPLGITGPSALDAALLAAHERNVAGAAGQRPVELILIDGGRSPSAVAREVGGLCAAGAIDAVAGFHTSDVHRAIEASVAGRTPYVFTPPHEGGRRLQGVVCIGTDPAQQLRGAVAWLAETYGLRRWALVGNDYIWPDAVHRVARRLVASTGGEIVLDRRVPLGSVPSQAERLVDAVSASRADAVLLSLVGHDLAVFNRVLRHSGLSGRLLRLSGSLEENGLLASGGDSTGLLYAAMQSFTTLQDDRRLGLQERYQSLFGVTAPVLDTYAEGVYDGVHLVSELAARDALHPGSVVAAAAGILSGGPVRPVHLARADGLEFAVVH